MFKTAWNESYYRPVPSFRYHKSDIKKDIATYIRQYGASTVEDLAEHLKKTNVAARFVMREMKREGALVSRRLNIAGNVTYWALTEDALDTIERNH